MNDRYKWQAEAKEKFGSAKNPPVFFVEACPGAGKTIFSLSVAVELQKQDPRLCIVVASPTDNVKKKFAKVAFNEFGVILKESIPLGFPMGGYAGITCTYAGLASRIEALQKWGKRFITVLDEVHHCDYDEDGSRAWGEAAVLLQEMSVNTLLMSGTPFRSCGTIPFLDQCRELDHQFKYTYSQGIADRVVRGVTFLMEDSPWSRVVEKPQGNVIFDGGGVASSNDDKSHRNNAIFKPSGDWVSQTIIEVAKNIDEKRAAGDKDAAALFICRSSERQTKNPGSHAKAISRRVKELTGEEPELVLSDIKGSSGRIEEFEVSRKKFIVSIAMVSEGVDIPRIRCVALMCSMESELRFRQTVGRAVRYEEDLKWEQRADIILPKFPLYQQYADAIEQEVKQGNRNRPKEPDPTPPESDGPPEEIVDTSTSERGKDATLVFRGDVITEYFDAAKKRNPHSSDEINMQNAISAWEHDDNCGRATDVNPEAEKKKYREEADRLLKKVYFRLRNTANAKEYKELHIILNERQGVNGIDDLHDNHGWERMKERRDILQEWLTKPNGVK